MAGTAAPDNVATAAPTAADLKTIAEDRRERLLNLAVEHLKPEGANPVGAQKVMKAARAFERFVVDGKVPDRDD